MKNRSLMPVINIGFKNSVEKLGLPIFTIIYLVFGVATFSFMEQVYGQSLTLDLGDSSGSGNFFSSKIIQFIGLVTILSLAPAILMMVTSFTKIVVVFSMLRTATGLQQTPPNSVMVGLALFLTFFIMAPTFDKAYHDGITPLIEDHMDEETAFANMYKPFQQFMLSNVREKDLSLFLDMAKITVASKDEMPSKVLIPAFMISELKKAFEIGFLIFLPFLVIDILVSSVLMAMGMMMLPPVMISLPFKVIFFVLIDGWYMICGSLVRSYSPV